jgi:hypothetical protein
MDTLGENQEKKRIKKRYNSNAQHMYVNNERETNKYRKYLKHICLIARYNYVP